MTIEANCHCGVVSFKLHDQPKWLTQCNCSICSKLGGLWAHSAIENIQIIMPVDATIRYIHGDKTLAFHTCKICGCTTHWESLSNEPDSYMAVNMRMLDPKTLSQYRIRKFDGADSWAYID